MQEYNEVMAEPKTKVTTASVRDFLNAIPDETKRKDSLRLLELFEEITGEKAKMWGPAIIGFGLYHYKSERSSQEGDWPLTGFSPRKQNLTLYVMSDTGELDDLLKNLGKHSTSKACLYIKKLSDVDENILKKIIAKSYTHAKKTLNA
jgi:hypothetical protein